MLNYIKSLFIKTPNKKPVVMKVIGRVPYPECKFLFKWVVSINDVSVVGSGTFFHTLGGHQLNTHWSLVCSELCTKAEMERSAGVDYKVFTWKELLGETQ